jgi:hypothetical protein
VSKHRLNILEASFLVAGFYLFFVTLFSRSLADNDLWGYLSFGRVVWEDGYFPYHDIFSYMPTKETWVYHEWLTGVLFYFVYKYSGAAGLQLLRYSIILFTIYLIYSTALKKGGKHLSASIALIPAMLLISFGYVPVRAQIFTYLFFILTLYILESARKNQKWSILWWLLPVQILWCNFHGGFVSGLGLIVLYALGEGLSGGEILPYVKIFLIASLVTLVNPYGFEYWVYTFQAVSMKRPEISEWMSILTALKNHVQDVPVFIFLFMAIVASFIFAFRRNRNITDLFIIGVTIFLGCMHIRHTILFGLVFGAYVPVLISEYWEQWKGKHDFPVRFLWVLRSTPAVVLLFLYLLINPFPSLTAVPSFRLLTPSSLFPVGAVNWIQENNVQGNILPHFDWGEFLIWTCYPLCHVAMDGRYETVYDDHVSLEYFDFLNGREGWDAFLKKYSHDMVLLRQDTKISQLMVTQPSWRTAYSDSGCVLFLRNREKR